MVESATLLAPTGNSRADSSQLDNNEPTPRILGVALAGAYYGVMDFPYGEFPSDKSDNSESVIWALAMMAPSSISEGCPSHCRLSRRQSRRLREARLDRPRRYPTVPWFQLDDVIHATYKTPSMHPLQEWEGWVVEVGDHEFVRTLDRLDRRARRPQKRKPLSRTPRSLRMTSSGLRQGDIFRWVIGYERWPSGTKKRVSQIVFSRSADHDFAG